MTIREISHGERLPDVPRGRSHSNPHLTPWTYSPGAPTFQPVSGDRALTRRSLCRRRCGESVRGREPVAAGHPRARHSKKADTKATDRTKQVEEEAQEVETDEKAEGTDDRPKNGKAWKDRDRRYGSKGIIKKTQTNRARRPRQQSRSKPGQVGNLG